MVLVQGKQVHTFWQVQNDNRKSSSPGFRIQFLGNHNTSEECILAYPNKQEAEKHNRFKCCILAYPNKQEAKKHNRFEWCMQTYPNKQEAKKFSRV